MKKMFFIKRVAFAVLTAFSVSFIVYLLLYLSPGDPAEMLAEGKSAGGGLNMATVERYAEILGTNKSFPEMYASWFKNMLNGDLGTSYKTGKPVLNEFMERFPCTFYITVMAGILSLLIGLICGSLSAKFRNGIFDKITRVFSATMMSVPTFWMAILFLWVFSVKLHLLPSFGYGSFKNLILPVLTLGISGSASLIRVTRSRVIDQMSESYVITARAKGLSELYIFIFHITKNVLIPVITMWAGHIIYLIGGSVIIENIYGLPGIGNFLLSSIRIKDYPATMGFVIITAVMVVTINMVVDLFHYTVDPRVRQA